MSVGPTVASVAEAHHRTSKGGSYAFSLNRGSDYLRRRRNLFLGHRKVRQ